LHGAKVGKNSQQSAVSSYGYKFQIPSTKFQTNSKIQNSNSKLKFKTQIQNSNSKLKYQTKLKIHKKD
jgi:hypothetical protein